MNAASGLVSSWPGYILGLVETLVYDQVLICFLEVALLCLNSADIVISLCSFNVFCCMFLNVFLFLYNKLNIYSLFYGLLYSICSISSCLSLSSPLAKNLSFQEFFPEFKTFFMKFQNPINYLLTYELFMHSVV